LGDAGWSIEGTGGGAEDGAANELLKVCPGARVLGMGAPWLSGRNVSVAMEGNWGFASVVARLFLLISFSIMDRMFLN